MYVRQEVNKLKPNENSLKVATCDLFRGDFFYQDFPWGIIYECKVPFDPVSFVKQLY